MSESKTSSLSIILIIVSISFTYSLGQKIWKTSGFNEVKIREVKIEVLNGCGVNDLAKNTTRYLRGEGFDVTFYGNAKERQTSTVVVDKLSPEKRWAQVVGEALGVDNLETNIDSSRCVNVIVILGMDYDKVLPRTIINRR